MARHAAMLLLAGALMLPAVARAQDASGSQPAAPSCKPLHKLSSIQMEKTPGGIWLVPVEIDGKPEKFVLDFTAQITGITRAKVDELDLATRKATGRSIQRLNDGAISTNAAKLGTVTLGQINFPNSKIMILPDLPKGQKRSADTPAGSLATDVLGNFDFAIDFANGTLNLFDRDHCPGQVVYWKSDTTVSLPFTFVGPPRFRFWMTVDDKPVVGTFYPFQSVNSLNLTVAKAAISFSETDQDVEAISQSPENKTKQYRRVFKSFNIGGLQFVNPKIVLVDSTAYWRLNKDRDLPEPRGNNWVQPISTGARVAEFNIGSATLNRLQIYFAMFEHKLYISLAEAPAPRATP